MPTPRKSSSSGKAEPGGDGAGEHADEQQQAGEQEERVDSGHAAAGSSRLEGLSAKRAIARHAPTAEPPGRKKVPRMRARRSPVGTRRGQARNGAGFEYHHVLDEFGERMRAHLPSRARDAPRRS